jgi:hypothetical protein
VVGAAEGATERAERVAARVLQRFGMDLTSAVRAPSHVNAVWLTESAVIRVALGPNADDLHREARLGELLPAVVGYPAVATVKTSSSRCGDRLVRVSETGAGRWRAPRSGSRAMSRDASERSLELGLGARPRISCDSPELPAARRTSCVHDLVTTAYLGLGGAVRRRRRGSQ